MSEGFPASHPASRSPTDGEGITLPPVQLREDDQQRGRQQGEGDGGGLPQQSRLSDPHGRSSTREQSGDSWRQPGQPRDLGVRSMLNPADPESIGSSARRFNEHASETPSSMTAPPAPFGTSPSASSHHSFPGVNPSSRPPSAEGFGGTLPRGAPPRRILTPRSPSRVVSAGHVPGTIDAQRSPFLIARDRPERAYTAQPGPSSTSDIPPMPTPPLPGQMGQQQHYGFPTSVSTPSLGPRGSGMQAPGRTPLSQSSSPSISASSYNPSSSQTSPAPFSRGGPLPPSSGSYYPGQSFSSSIQQGGGGLQFQGPSGNAGEGPYSAPVSQSPEDLSHSSNAGSSRQTSASDPIQVLTITTSQGSYSVPVDVHQASRLADEKRARNAGASARFRQRRKEKEKDANTAIEKLQSQTRDLERKLREVQSERDFYRSERDRFRDVVFRTPDVRHLAMQGPPSPQTGLGRGYGGSMQMGGPPPPPPPPLGYQVPESPERAPRRRRSDISGNFTSLSYSNPPASTPAPPPIPSPYTAQASHAQPPSLPPLRIESNPPPSTAPPSLPPTTSGPSGPYDPYARGSYDRGWQGDGGRR